MTAALAFTLEHLVSFLLEIVAAIAGGWIFAVWYPSIADYRARRSTRALLRKIAGLEEELKRYEEQFADRRLFISRIVFGTAVMLIFLVVTCFLITIAEIGTVLISIGCYFDSQKCQFIGTSSVVILILVPVIGSNVTAFFFFRLVNMVGLHVRPEEYRRVMNDRISRLRARISPTAL
jgi:hypothetical protein